jgi:hypothetical protein
MSHAMADAGRPSRRRQEAVTAPGSAPAREPSTDPSTDPAMDPASDPAAPEAPTELRIRRPADRGLVGVVPVDPVAVVEASVLRARAAQVPWGALSPAFGSRGAHERPPKGDRAADRRHRRPDHRRDGKARGRGPPEVLMVLACFVTTNARRTGCLPPGGSGPAGSPAAGPAFRSRWGWWRSCPRGTTPSFSPWSRYSRRSSPATGWSSSPPSTPPSPGPSCRNSARPPGSPRTWCWWSRADRLHRGALVDARPDHVHLVGGPQTGRAVLERAAEHLIPVSVELGREGPGPGAGRREPGAGGPGDRLRGLLQCGPDLHLHRAGLRGGPGLRGVPPGPGPGHHRTAGREWRRRRGGPHGPGFPARGSWRPTSPTPWSGGPVLCGGERADPASNIFLPTVLADVPEGARVLDRGDLRSRGRRGPGGECRRGRGPDQPASHGALRLHLDPGPGPGAGAGPPARAGASRSTTPCRTGRSPGSPWEGVGESGWSRARGDEGLLTFSRSRSILVRRGSGPGDPGGSPMARGTEAHPGPPRMGAHRGVGGFDPRCSWP